jgi:hypothetical protein
MSDMEDWQAAQWADECARMKQIVDALESAERAGTPKDVIDLLAYEAGVGEIYNQEKRA